MGDVLDEGECAELDKVDMEEVGKREEVAARGMVIEVEMEEEVEGMGTEEVRVEGLEIEEVEEITGVDEVEEISGVDEVE